MDATQTKGDTMDTNNTDRAAIDAAIKAAVLLVGEAYVAAIAARDNTIAVCAEFDPIWNRPGVMSLRFAREAFAAWEARRAEAVRAELAAWAKHEEALDVRGAAYAAAGI